MVNHHNMHRKADSAQKHQHIAELKGKSVCQAEKIEPHNRHENADPDIPATFFSYTFNCIRSFLGGLVLLPVIPFLDRYTAGRKPQSAQDRSRLLLGRTSRQHTESESTRPCSQETAATPQVPSAASPRRTSESSPIPRTQKTGCTPCAPRPPTGNFRVRACVCGGDFRADAFWEKGYSVDCT